MNPAIKHNQAIASLCNSSIEMAPVNQKGFEIAAYNTQTTKIAAIHFLKPSWLINFHGRNPIVSLDRFSQILVLPVTSFHVDGSINLFFILDGHEKCCTALIPSTSSSSRYCAVKKHADADAENDNSPDQYGNSDAVNPNAVPSVPLEYGEGSGVTGGNDGSGNGGDDGDKNGGNEGGNSSRNADNDQKMEQHPIRIHRIDVNVDANRNIKPIINTDLIASQYSSWKAFAAAIYHVWVDTNGLRHDNAPPIKQMNNLNCWPGAIASFGRYEDGNFIHCYWGRDQWEDVKTLITDVRVVRCTSVYLQDPSTTE